jgi:hypothetical protein
MRQIEAVETPFAAEAFGHPAEDLGRDDARIAACPHQRAEADRARNPLQRGFGHAFRLVECRADGGEHVGPGVAVRHRVDVEAVDLVDV